MPLGWHNLLLGPDDWGVIVFKGGLEVIFQPIKVSASQGLIFLWHSIEHFLELPKKAGFQPKVIYVNFFPFWSIKFCDVNIYYMGPPCCLSCSIHWVLQGPRRGLPARTTSRAPCLPFLYCGWQGEGTFHCWRLSWREVGSPLLRWKLMIPCSGTTGNSGRVMLLMKTFSGRFFGVPFGHPRSKLSLIEC